MRRLSVILGTILAAATMQAVQAVPAAAAPQVLALLPSGGNVVLRCEGADCGAEFGTICLQPERATPYPGQAYIAMTDGDVVLTGQAKDGSRRTLRLDGALSISSVRGYSAVRLSVPRAFLQAQGLRSLSVRIGEIAAIKPAPAADDPWPQSEADLALATGPLRKLAGRIADMDEARRGAARITAAAANALPPIKRVDKARWASVWRDAQSESATEVSGSAQALAQTGYEQCQVDTTNGWYFRFRDCLSRKHDGLVGTVNEAYWAALKAGS